MSDERLRRHIQRAVELDRVLQHAYNRFHISCPVREVDMGMAMKLADYLGAHPVPFELVAHSRAMSSLQSAKSMHLSPACVAKAVVLEDEDDQFLMAVLPASRRVNLGELRGRIGRMLRLASEAELRERFGDCEFGAVPPIGNAYGMDTVWDDSLTSQPDVYFEAGDHETHVHVRTRDFVGLLEGAQHLAFSAPMHRAGSRALF